MVLQLKQLLTWSVSATWPQVFKEKLTFHKVHMPDTAHNVSHCILDPVDPYSLLTTVNIGTLYWHLRFLLWSLIPGKSRSTAFHQRVIRMSEIKKQKCNAIVYNTVISK